MMYIIADYETVSIIDMIFVGIDNGLIKYEDSYTASLKTFLYQLLREYRKQSSCVSDLFLTYVDDKLSGIFKSRELAIERTEEEYPGKNYRMVRTPRQNNMVPVLRTA